ncbi:MAG: histidine kinase, partial [Treponema sp.]|nr:histidine kinase [Treponema sp.]
MKKSFINVIAFLGTVVFLAAGTVFFTVTYVVRAGTAADPIAPGTPYSLFLPGFYILVFLCGISFLGSRLVKNPFSRFFCLLFGLFTAIHCVYALDDYYTVNLFVYFSFIAAASLNFPFPRNLLISLTGIAAFIFFLYRPSFMGVLPDAALHRGPGFLQACALGVVMISFSLFGVLAEYFVNRYYRAELTIDHLNLVGKQMVQINHRLQELAKNYSEQAVKQDRLRFTRDLHDSCGYAFASIIAITDGAVSSGPMDGVNALEILQRIRNQASNGLKEMRAVLRLIREIGDPYTTGIDAIYRLKTVFEEVAGIQVSVEWGNIKRSYSPSVNATIVRIVQEAFTNSLQHGQATVILIHFWEHSGMLSMTVTDNGRGAPYIIKGIGMAGME